MTLTFRTILALIAMLFAQVSFGQYLIGGSASSIGGDCYQLTPAVNTQGGYVYKNQAIDLNDPFDLTFDVYLGTNNAGADGIVFVMRGTLAAPYIGASGGAIGYSGVGFTNSIGIEVDTWFNGGFSDIAADHIGMFKNGTVDHGSANSLSGPVQASPTTANVEDGNYHTFNVRWDPVTQRLEVYLDCDYRLVHTGDIINDIFNGDNTVHWGFLGTTGGANNVQRFCLTTPIDSLVDDLVDQTICDGDSAQLIAGDATADFAWSPSTGLSATNVHNPYAFPSATTNYYVTITHNCDTVLDTVKVTVIQPTYNAIGLISDAECFGDCNGEIDLSVNNGSGIYDYDWSNGATTQDLANLCAGNYTVTIQDMDPNSSTYSCTLIESYTVLEPPLLTTSISGATKTSCPDGTTCDASATATAMGGTFPYVFAWSSGENSPNANHLCADTNWVTVTDAHGCSEIDFVEIDIPDSIKTTAYGDTMICISSIASIIGASVGGTPPFSYIWHEGSLNGTVVSTNQTFAATPSVTTMYYVEATDANGCPGDTSEVLVKVRPPLTAEIENVDTICPYDTISINVTGYGGDSVYTYSWSNGKFGDEIIVSPNSSQWFAVTVGDVCGTPVYKDSVFIQVGGYPDIKSNIRVEDDSICIGGSTYLIVSGVGGFRGPIEYTYHWEHTNDKNQVQIVWPKKTTTYTAEVRDLCLSEAGEVSVTVYVGGPSTPSLNFTPDEACAESDVLMRIENFNPKYSYDWLINETESIHAYNSDSLIYQFDTEGCNQVEVTAITEYGCVASRQEKCAVKILAAPQAAYLASPSNPSNVDQVVTFSNASERAESWVWYIQGDTLYNATTFHIYYEDSLADMSFELVAISSDGCVDTLHHELAYSYHSLLYYPKAFTPNGDGKNEVFMIRGEALGDVGFQLRIFDRWGQQVFRSVNPRFGWNGLYPDGTHAPQGAYPFTLEYTDELGEHRFIRDHVIISTGGIPQTTLR